MIANQEAEDFVNVSSGALPETQEFAPETQELPAQTAPKLVINDEGPMTDSLPKARELLSPFSNSNNLTVSEPDDLLAGFKADLTGYIPPQYTAHPFFRSLPGYNYPGVVELAAHKEVFITKQKEVYLAKQREKLAAEREAAEKEAAEIQAAEQEVARQVEEARKRKEPEHITTESKENVPEDTSKPEIDTETQELDHLSRVTCCDRFTRGITWMLSGCKKPNSVVELTDPKASSVSPKRLKVN